MAGQITGFLFAEQEAHDVPRVMCQIVVCEVDDRETRFGKAGGDSVDRGGGKEGSDHEVVLLSREQ